MGTISFEIREDGRDYWIRYYSVELDTEDYDNIDQMRDAAYEMVQDGEIEGSEKDYGDDESDEIEHTDDDYNEDEDYEWRSEKPSVKTPAESAISW